MSLALALAGMSPALGTVPEDILVSAVATRGSPHQPEGAELLAGVEAAAARLNAAGGVLGRRVRVVGWSEDCTRLRAQQIADEVARLKPALVIGHLCAGAALAAAPIYVREGVLLIAPGVRHPALTAAREPLVLRLAGRDDRFAADTARFIQARFAGERVAVVADRTQQGRGLGAAMAAELARLGVAMALDERFESSEKSYDALAQRVRAAGATVVLMPAQPIELGILVAGLGRAGVAATLVGSEIMAVPAIEPMARQQAERLVLMLPWTGIEQATAAPPAAAPSGTAEARRLAARARAEAALQVWAAAVQRAAAVDASAVAAALRSGTADTAVGQLGFDARGDALVPSYTAHSWRDGGWRIVGP